MSIDEPVSVCGMVILGGILCLVAMERVRGGVVIISSVTLYDNFFLSDSLLILNLNYSL